MLFLTVPVLLPMILSLDTGLPHEETAIWFGIAALVVIGTGQITPPVCLYIFIASANAQDVPMKSTVRSLAPFIAADLVKTPLMITFPWISLWLVRLVYF